jgi:hypothetical protein|tara:strand:+ start:332 stop:607 length:276 start_codon:yes stop_codon:yes gene_type:complete
MGTQQIQVGMVVERERPVPILQMRVMGVEVGVLVVQVEMRLELLRVVRVFRVMVVHHCPVQSREHQLRVRVVGRVVDGPRVVLELYLEVVV